MVQSTVRLASGYEMPLVGFGLWKVPATQAADTVYNVSIGPKLIVEVGREANEIIRTGHQGRLPMLRRSL